MTDDAKPQGTVQIALRISPDLRARVKAAADANNRSVNSELTVALEERYPPPIPSEEDLAAALERSKEILDEVEDLLAKLRPGMPEESWSLMSQRIEALLNEHRALIPSDDA